MQLIGRNEIRKILKEHDYYNLISIGAPDNEYDGIADEIYSLLLPIESIDDTCLEQVSYHISLLWHRHWYDQPHLPGIWTLNDARHEIKDTCRQIYAAMLISEATNILADLTS